MDECPKCGARRPRWHGGFHECKVLGQAYYVGPQFYFVTDAELNFLRADYR